MKYFLHDSNAFNDEKITELFIEFGYEGLGLFYTILEKLAQQEKPIKTAVLKAQLKVGKKLNKCWNFMESLELISSNNGETFNKQLLNFSEKYKIKSEKNAKRISEWREKQIIEENVTRSESFCNTPKVKESKIKESKKLKNKECAQILNDYCLKFFDAKYVNEKSLIMFDKLLNEYKPDQIRKAIENGKSDTFWNNQFLSPLKLQTKNKENVLYIDKFLSLKGNKLSKSEFERLNDI